MSTQIHPTAIVATGAELGDDCEIGPYCVVGSKVRLGSGTRLHSHVVVEGNTTLGEGCELFPFACVGGKTQDLKYKGGEAFVEIGTRTTLREYVTVHAATEAGGRTVVGEACHILAYCHVAHNCILGNGIIMSNATNLAGHVIVEDRVVFGGCGGVHQFVRIGTMAMIGATAKVVQDIAPYCLTDGNPAEPVTVNRVGLQRNGKSSEAIRIIETAYKILFRSALTLQDAVARLRQEFPDQPEIVHLVEFVLASQRGLARPRRTSEP